MIWMKRDFAYADYAPAMGELEKLLMASGPLYAEFIMVWSILRAIETTGPRDHVA
jgi:hypothetical protein